VGQDYHYLSFYAKAYSAALAKCTGQHAEHAPIIQGMLDGARRSALPAIARAAAAAAPPRRRGPRRRRASRRAADRRASC
jgi:hypothetical protein